MTDNVLISSAIDISSLPRLPLDKRGQLPLCSAVYFALNEANEPLYIGKAVQLGRRWTSHHRLSQLQKMQNISIAWMEVPRNQLDELEGVYIKMFNPPLNRSPYPSDGPKRMSIYINPRDAIVINWLEKATEDGTSESEAILKLIRKSEKNEPSPVEQALRERIAFLERLLRIGVG